MENQTKTEVTPVAMLPKTDTTVDNDSLKTAILKQIRKNPAKFLALAKRKKYYHEDNHENAIINMLNSGLGRKGRRNLAKKMMLGWVDFLDSENIVVENNLDVLTPGAKRSYLSSRWGLFKQNKITIDEYNIFYVIVTAEVSYEEAEKAINKIK